MTDTDKLREYLRGYHADFVGRRAGLTGQTVRNFVKGRHAPSRRTRHALAQFVKSQQIVARQADTQ